VARVGVEGQTRQGFFFEQNHAGILYMGTSTRIRPVK
jgi:hypothetical protein